MSIIDFKQVAAPSFADSNALLRAAMEQSSKAGDGLLGTLNTAVTNIEDNNLAKIQQLVDSQTKEQLMNPEYQAQMQSQISNMMAPTGNTVNQQKVNALANDRIKLLGEQETTDSNLRGAKITQLNNAEIGRHNVVSNGFEELGLARKETNEQEDAVIANMVAEVGLAAEKKLGIQEQIAALKAVENPDEAAITRLNEDIAIIDNQLESAYANLPSSTIAKGMNILKGQDQADEDRIIKNQGLLAATANVVGRTTNDAALTASTITEREITNEVNLRRMQLEEFKTTSGSGNKEFEGMLETTRGEFTEAGISANTVNSKNEVNFDSYSSQLTNNVTQAALLSVNGGEPIDYLKEAGTILATTGLSDKQKRDLDSVLSGKNLPDDQKLMFIQKIANNPLLAKDWWSNKGALEKNLQIALDEYKNSDKGRAINQVKRTEYAKGLRPLYARGLSDKEIAEKLKITANSSDIDLMPPGIQDIVGHTKNKEKWASIDANTAAMLLEQARVRALQSRGKGRDFTPTSNAVNSGVPNNIMSGN